MAKAKRLVGIFPTMDINQIRTMAANGMSRAQIGAYHGVTGQRIGQLIKEHPELENAFEHGLSQGIEKATKSLMTLIENGNIIATLFYLKSRAGWVEQQHLKEKPILTDSVKIFLPDNNRGGIPVLEECNEKND